MLIFGAKIVQKEHWYYKRAGKPLRESGERSLRIWARKMKYIIWRLSALDKFESKIRTNEDTLAFLLSQPKILDEYVISWITVRCVNVKVTSRDNEIWMSHYSGYSRHANLISKSLFSVTPYPSTMVSNNLLGNRFPFSTMDKTC